MAVTHSRSDRFVRQPILDLHFIGPVFATGPVRTGPMVPKLGLVPNLGPVPGPVPQNYPKFNTFSVY